MKTRKIILSFILCICAILPVFALSGCGKKHVDEVKSSFADLEATYSEYADVFVVGSLENGQLQTKYKIKYGVDLDAVASSGDEEKFDALDEKYNIMLAISSRYIDANKAFVQSLEQDNLSKDTKDALGRLDKSLTSYNKYIPKFVDELNDFKTHFENHSGNAVANLAVLQNFKKFFGELVEKNIELALDVAKVIETTKVFDLLKSTTPTAEDSKTVKDYISAKMLPIFNNLLIKETETAFSYGDYENAAMNELDDVVERLEQLFDVYKARLIVSSNEKAVASQEAMKKVFDDVNEFFVEKDVYLSCVDELDIYKLVVESESFIEHEKKVEFASIYFNKIKQFINITLEDYMNNLVKVIYGD